MNNDVKEKDVLDEIEEIMMKEVRFLSEQGSKATNQQLQTMDRIVKGAGVVLAVENLKERKYMNRTNRKSEIRKAKKD